MVMSDLRKEIHYTSVEELPGIRRTFFKLTASTEVSIAPFEEPSECEAQWTRAFFKLRNVILHD